MSIANDNRYKDELTKCLGFKMCYEGFKKLFKDEFGREALDLINKLKDKCDQEDRANKASAKADKSNKGNKGRAKKVKK